MVAILGGQMGIGQIVRGSNGLNEFLCSADLGISLPGASVFYFRRKLAFEVWDVVMVVHTNAQSTLFKRWFD
jgi:hypothetical protein